MNILNLLNLNILIPELFLAVAALVGLVIGVISKYKDAKIITSFAFVAIVVAAFLLLDMSNQRGIALNSMFVQNNFTVTMKFLVLVTAAIIMLMSLSVAEEMPFELPIIILLAVIGMMCMISSRDLIGLYMAIELMSLPSYIMAAIKRDDSKSSEAGLKYFILGALSSGLLLYGASLIYGFTGHIGFLGIADYFTGKSDIGANSIGILVGLIFVMIGFFFKISAVPFHMWAPDVYQGSPTIITAFFATAPKIAAIALLLRLLFEPFAALQHQWMQIVIFVSAASMLIGAVGGIRQENIKRLLAYSSIGHIGYMLMGFLVISNADGVQAVIFYLITYVLLNLGLFAAVLMMKDRENISDFSGLARTNPMVAMMVTVILVSMIGIPPFAGFFAKFYIFKAAIEANQYYLAIFGVITSVIAAYYYLRIIKVMYFDESSEKLQIQKGLSAILALASAFSAFLFLYLAPILMLAKIASMALIR